MKSTTNICCFILGLLLLFPFKLSAQQEKVLIMGVVSDTEGYAMIQASIIERSKDNRTLSSAVTDIDGNFSINMVDPNNQLVFKYLGYKEKVVVPGKNRNLKVVMEESSATLGEVVITAQATQDMGGLAIRERDLSMAISKISAEELEGVHAASIDDALQGRLSGVDIVGSTGNPGGGCRFVSVVCLQSMATISL